ncbi:helix-turn-helix domain-containing protein [Leucothrix arctica]|uniref:Transcriptional regulator FNR n=1 Tax=Leucothrix arctica TaxID=1481894 RepID=A0A317C560_9GAMM|nr:helix-turn-helix domain-containing protein [Leucothrix arctica]PWQ93795.1 transcriptional regulator FNR [Leucothrix arctica]
MNHSVSHTKINTLSNVHSIDRNDFIIRNCEKLFNIGDRLSGIYRINSGSVKLYRSNEAGQEQILGFYTAGDIFGLDALSDGKSQSSATILETSNISLIPFNTLLKRENSGDYKIFMQQVGINHNRDIDHTMMLLHCSAGRRLAWFFIKFSDNLSKRGYRADEFTLPMTRKDIALYLGVAAETLSRVFARFCAKGFIRIIGHQRSIKILEIDVLRNMINRDD